MGGSVFSHDGLKDKHQGFIIKAISSASLMRLKALFFSFKSFYFLIFSEHILLLKWGAGGYFLKQIKSLAPTSYLVLITGSLRG